MHLTFCYTMIDCGIPTERNPWRLSGRHPVFRAMLDLHKCHAAGALSDSNADRSSSRGLAGRAAQAPSVHVCNAA
jgi:hypothetical protein